jgi:glycosyltransferase involved in cell wall biosynthesis
VPPHALPLGYWIKKWRPAARVIYFNHDPFLADLSRKPWYFRRYVRMLLGAVDGVHSGSWLPDRYAAAIVSVPRTISHLFASEEFEGIRRDSAAEDLIMIGALHLTKGIREGIAAFQAFRDRLGRPIRLTVIGDGPLRKEIEVTALADKDIWFLGQQPPSVVATELSRSSVLLMLSRFDTFPAAVLEAARVGVLPLMSDRVGSSNIFPKELVVPVGDEKAAVERLLWLYQLSSSEQQALRDRVQAVGREFTRERQCSRFHEAITELMERMDRPLSASVSTPAI